MIEFTGERVVPGQVNDDLWAEHIARYRFAANFATGRNVLDLGCGTGYGTNELAARAHSATGVDISQDAIGYAQANYAAATFVPHAATDVPLPDSGFDLITAFELIEHLEDWRPLLAEAKRLLAPQGLFLVSTPNKLYYSEARAESGPNPFHEHEFEYQEFNEALREFFPHAEILLQDRLESFAFYQPALSNSKPATPRAEIADRGSAPADANFFIGVCSMHPLPELSPFLYVPSAANLLRERELHISKLQGELAKVHAWLDETTQAHALLQAKHTGLQQHLEQQNRWSQQIEVKLREAQARVQAADQEIGMATAQLAALERDNKEKREWAQRLDGELREKAAELSAAVDQLHQTEAVLVDRTEWAQRLDRQVESLSRRLAMASQSRWMKLGRRLNLGPRLDDPPTPDSERPSDSESGLR